MDSRLGFSSLTPSEESFVVPLVGGKHVGTVVDAQNRHLLGVGQVLQQLVAKTGEKITNCQGPHIKVVSYIFHSTI